mgnify:CR=1 FL=1|jgi:hypothetical protein
MASIVIEDLIENADLDSEAMSALVGGYVSGFGWIRPYQHSVGSFNHPIVNQYFTLNQYVADEIQIINQDQYVSIVNSDGALVNLSEDANNDLTKALTF